jgi:hypothetical protein
MISSQVTKRRPLPRQQSGWQCGLKGLQTGASEPGRQGNGTVLCGRSAWERNHTVWAYTSISSSTKVKEADTFISSIAHGSALGGARVITWLTMLVQPCTSADGMEVTRQIVCDGPEGSFKLEEN